MIKATDEAVRKEAGRKEYRIASSTAKEKNNLKVAKRILKF